MTEPTAKTTNRFTKVIRIICSFAIRELNEEETVDTASVLFGHQPCAITLGGQSVNCLLEVIAFQRQLGVSLFPFECYEDIVRDSELDTPAEDLPLPPLPTDNIPEDIELALYYKGSDGKLHPSYYTFSSSQLLASRKETRTELIRRVRIVAGGEQPPPPVDDSHICFVDSASLQASIAASAQARQATAAGSADANTTDLHVQMKVSMNLACGRNNIRGFEAAQEERLCKRWQDHVSKVNEEKETMSREDMTVGARSVSSSGDVIGIATQIVSANAKNNTTTNVHPSSPPSSPSVPASASSTSSSTSSSPAATLPPRPPRPPHHAHTNASPYPPPNTPARPPASTYTSAPTTAASTSTGIGTGTQPPHVPRAPAPPRPSPVASPTHTLALLPTSSSSSSSSFASPPLPASSSYTAGTEGALWRSYSAYGSVAPLKHAQTSAHTGSHSAPLPLPSAHPFPALNPLLPPQSLPMGHSSSLPAQNVLNTRRYGEGDRQALTHAVGTTADAMSAASTSDAYNPYVQRGKPRYGSGISTSFGFNAIDNAPSLNPPYFSTALGRAASETSNSSNSTSSLPNFSSFSSCSTPSVVATSALVAAYLPPNPNPPHPAISDACRDILTQIREILGYRQGAFQLPPLDTLAETLTPLKERTVALNTLIRDIGVSNLSRADFQDIINIYKFLFTSNIGDGYIKAVVSLLLRHGAIVTEPEWLVMLYTTAASTLAFMTENNPYSNPHPHAATNSATHAVGARGKHRHHTPNSKKNVGNAREGGSGGNTGGVTSTNRALAWLYAMVCGEISPAALQRLRESFGPYIVCATMPSAEMCLIEHITHRLCPNAYDLKAAKGLCPTITAYNTSDDALKCVLQTGYTSNGDSEATYPLSLAVWEGRLDAVRLLLHYKANPCGVVAAYSDEQHRSKDADEELRSSYWYLRRAGDAAQRIVAARRRVAEVAQDTAVSAYAEIGVLCGMVDVPAVLTHYMSMHSDQDMRAVYPHVDVEVVDVKKICGSMTRFYKDAPHHPVLAAYERGHRLTVLALLVGGANCDGGYAHPVLLRACNDGYIEMVRTMLDHGVRVPKELWENRQCLHADIAVLLNETWVKQMEEGVVRGEYSKEINEMHGCRDGKKKKRDRGREPERGRGQNVEGREPGEGSMGKSVGRARDGSTVGEVDRTGGGSDGRKQDGGGHKRVRCGDGGNGADSVGRWENNRDKEREREKEMQRDGDSAGDRERRRDRGNEWARDREKDQERYKARERERREDRERQRNGREREREGEYTRHGRHADRTRSRDRYTSTSTTGSGSGNNEVLCTSNSSVHKHSSSSNNNHRSRSSSSGHDNAPDVGSGGGGCGSGNGDNNSKTYQWTWVRPNIVVKITDPAHKYYRHKGVVDRVSSHSGLCYILLEHARSEYGGSDGNSSVPSVSASTAVPASSSTSASAPICVSVSREKDLETVVPDRDAPIVVVRGRYSGCKGWVNHRNAGRMLVDVEVKADGKLVKVYDMDFDDVCMWQRAP